MLPCTRRRLLSTLTGLLRLHPPSEGRSCTSTRKLSSSSNGKGVDGDDDWNEAWETAWLPDDLSGKNRAPWETDVNFPDSQPSRPIVLPSDADPDAKAFVDEMEERWDERRKAASAATADTASRSKIKGGDKDSGLGGMDDDDYRLKKQRIHASLWMKEIEKMEESRLVDADGFSTAGMADIDRLLDSYTEIFNSSHNELNNAKLPSVSYLQAKPDGWETTTKVPDANVWEVTQWEEDILLQEFERRIAFSKFQIASFIKTHIFSRRRPIDGWKHMIEELGPNARRGKGSVQRLPNLVDSSIQPFKDKATTLSNFSTSRRR